MAKGDFNSNANPKVKTEHFKIYLDVGDGAEEWELQGRGVESWTVEENSDIEKTTDVLGLVDMERSVAQPTQSGVALKLRKESKLAKMLFDAWYRGDTSKLDSVSILQKFEFADADDGANCLARKEDEVMIAINNFTGEAGGYLGFEIDIHYANKRTFGTMPLADGAKVTFTPDEE